jgi:hypothetical protein
MTTTFNNTLEYILIDRENAHITLSKASVKLNETQPVFKKANFRTIADMGEGKFRRMFDRHKAAYRY